MSVYTTQLRWIVERLQHQAHADPDDFSCCYQYLGLDSYPIFDESYRSTLNDKIIRHYYFREIGFETSAQFAWFLRNTMNERMPYFNKLYESELVQFDPLTNKKYSWTDIYTMAQGGTTNTSTSASGSTTKNTTENVTDSLAHGERIDTTKGYGRTDSESKTFGKTNEGTKTTEFGKTTDGTSTTRYGRTQNTVNGGSDQMLEGATKERVIREDTPMNLIPNGAVENLNYATDVTYTDREGETASVTTYGGTTAITSGGSDTTSSSGSEGGAENVSTTSTDGGSESLSKSSGGTDTLAETHSGTDTRTITKQGGETGSHTDTGGTDFERNLDESGERTHNISGYDGIAPSDLIMKWRESFLNIDMQVIGSLNILFFGLWN